LCCDDQFDRLNEQLEVITDVRVNVATLDSYGNILTVLGLCLLRDVRDNLVNFFFAHPRALHSNGLVGAHRQEQPIACKDSEPEPDIAVVAGTIEDFAQAHPTTATLIVEVSISTLERDREKAAIYAEAGVAEYWLVNPEDGWVEQFSAPQAGIYTQCVKLDKSALLTCLSFPHIQLNLSDLLA
jgi:hypothetical protein